MFFVNTQNLIKNERKISKMYTPSVSVIIPCHNEEEVIERTIAAILAQDYPDFEVIVVDNSCTDRTVERTLAAAKCHPKFEITVVNNRTDTPSARARRPRVQVVSEARKGTMWACERGREAASGEILVRMDADCLPDRNWLSRGVALFENPGISGASGPCNFMDHSRCFQTATLLFQCVAYRIMSILVQIFQLGALMNGGNSFIRASALEKAGGFNTAITFYGDDVDTARRLSKYGWVSFTTQITLKTSARRYLREGSLKTMSKYAYHYLRIIFSSPLT